VKLVCQFIRHHHPEAKIDVEPKSTKHPSAAKNTRVDIIAIVNNVKFAIDVTTINPAQLYYIRPALDYVRRRQNQVKKSDGFIDFNELKSIAEELDFFAKADTSKLAKHKDNLSRDTTFVPFLQLTYLANLVRESMNFLILLKVEKRRIKRSLLLGGIYNKILFITACNEVLYLVAMYRISYVIL
jgi:hypothetical protein